MAPLGTTWWRTTPKRANAVNWFPKIAVYDDLRGWDAEPYQGAEFYEGYGDYQVSLTVPNGWTVMAAVELLNPEQVYSPRTRAKMAAAAVADTMVRIATREDVESARVTELSVTERIRRLEMPTRWVYRPR